MVQNIDGRPLQFEPDTFSDPDSLGNAKVKVKVTRTAEAVDREIAERARRGRRHQTSLKGGRRRLAGGRTSSAQGYVEEIWVDKEHAGRCLE